MYKAQGPAELRPARRGGRPDRRCGPERAPYHWKRRGKNLPNVAPWIGRTGIRGERSGERKEGEHGAREERRERRRRGGRRCLGGRRWGLGETISSASRIALCMHNFHVAELLYLLQRGHGCRRVSTETAPGSEQFAVFSLICAIACGTGEDDMGKTKVAGEDGVAGDDGA
jgi:hypothetical protein